MIEEDVRHTCPPDVHPHQWIDLVHYWFSERAQVMYTLRTVYYKLINF